MSVGRDVGKDWGANGGRMRPGRAKDRTKAKAQPRKGFKKKPKKK